MTMIMIIMIILIILIIVKVNIGSSALALSRPRRTMVTAGCRSLSHHWGWISFSVYARALLDSTGSVFTGNIVKQMYLCVRKWICAIFVNSFMCCIYEFVHMCCICEFVHMCCICEPNVVRALDHWVWDSWPKFCCELTHCICICIAMHFQLQCICICAVFAFAV